MKQIIFSDMQQQSEVVVSVLCLCVYCNFYFELSDLIQCLVIVMEFGIYICFYWYRYIFEFLLLLKG